MELRGWSQTGSLNHDGSFSEGAVATEGRAVSAGVSLLAQMSQEAQSEGIKIPWILGSFSPPIFHQSLSLAKLSKRTKGKEVWEM